MTWAALALVLLKIVNQIMAWVRESEQMSKGYDRAMADQAAAILKKTKAGKEILERVNALSDAEVDAGLRDLEPR